MAQPVLVRAYTSRRTSSGPALGRSRAAPALPPISSYAFADILRAADSPDFQHAIDGIAEICAKNRLSLADEYASHLPPLGEITTATPATMKPHLMRPGGMRCALTSVPEGSSGSSEGSRKSVNKSGIFGFRKQQVPEGKPMRRMRIGSMGRTMAVGSTTALAAEAWNAPEPSMIVSEATAAAGGQHASELATRTASDARTSLRRLLAGTGHGSQPG